MTKEAEAVIRHRAHYLEIGRKAFEKERDLYIEVGHAERPIDKESIKFQIRKVQAAADLDNKQVEQALNSDKRSFVAQLPSDISRHDFMYKLGEASIPSDRDVLGNEVSEQLACAVLYPSVMAEFPATFDTVAIAGIVDMVGSSEPETLMHPETNLAFTNEVVSRTGYLTNRMLELGAIEHSHENRFMIPPKKKQKLGKILEQFDE